MVHLTRARTLPPFIALTICTKKRKTPDSEETGAPNDRMLNNRVDNPAGHSRAKLKELANATFAYFALTLQSKENRRSTFGAC